MKPQVCLPIFLLFSGCILEPPDNSKLPIWSTSVDIPLIDSEINLETLLEDSLVTTMPWGEDDERVYVFRKSVELERFTVGNHLKADPVEQTFVHYASAVTLDSATTRFSISLDAATLDDINEPYSTAIGLIRLDNISPGETDPYLFTEIMPSAIVATLDSAISAAGGSANLLIDTLDLVPSQKSLDFESLRSVDVSSGFLDVTLINEMFLPLGAPIIIDVKDSLGTLLFSLTWADEIAVGDSATETQDLSGLVLPGRLLVKVSGKSNGSGGVPILVDSTDLSSSFRTRITARNVEVTRADAKVPSQSITDSSTSVLEPSDTIVEDALLLTAQLAISVENGIPLSGNLTLNVPSLYYQSLDSMFSLNFPLLPGSNMVPPTDLAGWSIMMDPAAQELDYSYSLITDATDPGFVVLDSSDRVDLTFSLTNISISELRGTIAVQTVIDSGDIAIGSDSRIQIASIASGSLKLSIVNRVGGRADVHVVVPGLLRNGLPLDTVLFIGPAETIHSIPLAGYDALPVSIDDQRFTYRMETTTRSEFGTYFLLDSVDVEVTLEGLEFDAITGYISQAENINEDFINLESGTIVESALIDSGAIQVTIRNAIGLAAELQIEIDALTLGNSALNFMFPVTPETTPQNFSIDVSGYALSLTLDDQRLRYTSTLTVPSTELLTLSLDDSITATVSVDTLWFGAIRGIIDSISIAIDTVEQMFSELPSALEHFDFTEAQIRLNIDSDITIPVFLSTILTAYGEDGSQESSSVANWNITDSASVQIPEPNRLINIRPERISAHGSARLGGDGTVGDIAAGQSLGGAITITAPLVLTLDSNATIRTAPYLVTSRDSSDSTPLFTAEIERVQLFITYRNDFDFGASLDVYMGPDTSLLAAGTGATLIDGLRIVPGHAGLDSLTLTDERLDLFNRRAMYIQAHINLLTQTDSSGAALPATFLSTDTLRLNISGRVHYLMDGPKLAEGDQ